MQTKRKKKEKKSKTKNKYSIKQALRPLTLNRQTDSQTMVNEWSKQKDKQTERQKKRKFCLDAQNRQSI